MSDNEIKIPPTYKKDIETVLGRSIDPSDENVVKRLELISDSVIDDLKKIDAEVDEITAQRYLRFLTLPEYYPYIRRFLVEILDGDDPEAGQKKI